LVDDISARLFEAHKRDRQNFIEKYCKQFDFGKLTDADLEKLAKSFSDQTLFEYLALQYKHEMELPLTSVEIQRLQQLNRKYKYGVVRVNNYHNLLRSSRRLFGNHCQIPRTFIPSVITVAVENEIGELFRTSENNLREKEGLPRIGEGWVSETELFRKLQKQFPDKKIIKHAKPSWLTPQHLDIYFPAQNIAIEYQGVQHLKPVDYFGGLAAFEAQKVRDERKRLLCYHNNCPLIYVYERYDFADLVKEIDTMLAST
jgi:hypothetical protein